MNKVVVSLEFWVRNRLIGWTILVGWAVLSGGVCGADLSAWRWRQSLEVPQPGLVKIELPAETLDVMREDQGDLRLLDTQGLEVPYLIDQSLPSATVTQRLEQLTVAVRGQTTILQLTNVLKVLLESVEIDTPAPAFLKSVTIEVAANGKGFVVQSAGQFLFRQASGAQRSVLNLRAQPGDAIRLTLDDTRSPAIPVTGLRLLGAAVEEVSPYEQPVPILRREEGTGETRLLLDFGARHLQVANLRLSVDDPVFVRPVSLISRIVEDEQIKEQILAGGILSRSNGSDRLEGQTLAVESRLPQRRLWVAIRNEDSPPLRITAATASVRPTHLIFQASGAGTFLVYSGNDRATLANYDLIPLRARLREVPLSDLGLGNLVENPAYRRPEILADVPLLGREMDVSEWTYRKEVQIKENGIQELELDLEVLAHARPDLADVRLLQAGHQVPYLVERSAATRVLHSQFHVETDAKNPSVQRWKLPLPVAASPVNLLTASAITPLFQRDVRLYELPVDGRGEVYRRDLGHAQWTRTPEGKETIFRIALDAAPHTDTLVLEVDNGDNSMLVLQGFELSYPVTRLLFKAGVGDRMELYYGQGKATRPHYDLTLMGRQVVQAERRMATLGAEQRLRAASWQETPPMTGMKGVVFWGVLILVVAGLLVIVIRLLPRKAE